LSSIFSKEGKSPSLKPLMHLSSRLSPVDCLLVRVTILFNESLLTMKLRGGLGVRGFCYYFFPGLSVSAEKYSRAAG
jgi:hypothetical protein